MLPLPIGTRKTKQKQSPKTWVFKKFLKNRSFVFFDTSFCFVSVESVWWKTGLKVTFRKSIFYYQNFEEYSRVKCIMNPFFKNTVKFYNFFLVLSYNFKRNIILFRKNIDLQYFVEKLIF
jgi:hypothetical protein